KTWRGYDQSPAGAIKAVSAGGCEPHQRMHTGVAADAYPVCHVLLVSCKHRTQATAAAVGGGSLHVRLCDQIWIHHPFHGQSPQSLYRIDDAVDDYLHLAKQPAYFRSGPYEDHAVPHAVGLFLRSEFIPRGTNLLLLRLQPGDFRPAGDHQEVRQRRQDQGYPGREQEEEPRWRKEIKIYGQTRRSHESQRRGAQDLRRGAGFREEEGEEVGCYQ